MFRSILNPSILLPLAVFGAFCAWRTLSSWVKGLSLLIGIMIFGGLVGVRLGSAALPILFRDATVVLPLYTAFFTSKSGGAALKQVPTAILLALATVLGWFLICLFNPTQATGLQLLVGLRVWLLYVPLLFVGVALAARPEAMVKVLRVLLVCGLVAAAVGLLQAILVRIIGFQPAITLFFGEGARVVTQEFRSYHEAGGIYRIPGTFSFASQYVGFLYVLVTVAMIELHIDPDRRFRRLGLVTLFVALIAGVVSGTKGALITFPVFLIGYALFGLIQRGLGLAVPLGLVAGGIALEQLGVKLGGLFSFGAEIAREHARNFVFQQIGGGLEFGALGQGIGTSTGAGRYVAPEVAPIGVVGFESYFGKIGAELGQVGLVVFVIFFLVVAVKTFMIVWQRRRTPANALVAPLFVFLMFTLISCLKGAALDVDPANVFFWLMLGLLLGTDRVLHRQALTTAGVDLAPAPSGAAAGAAVRLRPT